MGEWANGRMGERAWVGGWCTLDFEDEDDDEDEDDFEGRSEALWLLAIGYWSCASLRPLSVMALVEEGELRKVSKVLAASGSLDPTTIPAEKRVIF